jgi:hypothetical protein
MAAARRSQGPVGSSDQALPGMPVSRSKKALSSPFGAENRAWLLDRYFSEVDPVTAVDAWKHVYRLLLWIDRTTGLAHCYESDKSQPGRAWYSRSLAFHGWIAAELNVPPASVADSIDLLFKKVTSDLAERAASAAERGRAAAEAQREPYRDRDFPVPGENPELQQMITAALDSYLSAEPSQDAMVQLTRRIQAYAGQENKRKNLVGEGFEDTVAAILQRIDRISDGYEIYVRPVLHELPGFRPAPQSEKVKKVDLALVQRGGSRRLLVSCKWSVRSDREEQFMTDYDAYTHLNELAPFEYILLTNEFDPARLTAACTKQKGNKYIFDHVVHVNTAGPSASYAAKLRYSPKVEREDGGQAQAQAHIRSGRLSSLAGWLDTLGGAD